LNKLHQLGTINKVSQQMFKFELKALVVPHFQSHLGKMRF
jgi:hypothetical protein